MGVLITLVHVIVCFALIGIVLLQQGKGADMGAAFGGSSQTVFGATGAATMLSKLTAGAAILFMVTSFGLSYRSSHRYEETVMPETTSAPAAAPAPAEGNK